MKNTLYFRTLLSLFIILFISCDNKKEDILREIDNLKEQAFKQNESMPDSVSVERMCHLYSDFVSSYPDDTLSPSFLFKAGDLSAKTGNPEAAIAYFDKLVNDYPESYDAPYGLFWQGFICENQFGDPARAKPYYEKFIKMYPDHHMATDASFSLENLGKSNEEIIRNFENSSNADSTENAGSSN